MRRYMVSLMAVLALAAGVAAPVAAATTSYVTMLSDPGDWVGLHQQRFYVQGLDSVTSPAMRRSAESLSAADRSVTPSSSPSPRRQGRHSIPAST